ncbi:MAG: putative integral rane protein [Chthonomonadaceae bacterium]|nr:putative integral rane protein [Chthonomonadaceae bacterium]
MSDFYLFRTALRDLLRPGKLIAAAILIALPLLIGIVIKWKMDPETYEAANQYGRWVVVYVFGFVLTILSVIFSSGIVAQEVEQKTIVYLLTRPLPRWRILLMKFLAAILVTTAVCALATLSAALATFGPAKLGASPLGHDILILPVGVTAYSAIFLLMGTLLNRPLILGLIFAFGWENLIGVLPGYGQYCSIMTYLRVLAPHELPEAMLRLISLNTAGVDPPSRTFSWIVMISLAVIALVSACIAFSTREYVPREDAT